MLFMYHKIGVMSKWAHSYVDLLALYIKCESVQMSVCVWRGGWGYACSWLRAAIYRERPT